MKEEMVNIVGMGARTSIGFNMLTTASAVRAKMNRFAEHPYMLDQAGEPMIVAMDAELPEEVIDSTWFIQLAVPAVLEALRPVKKFRLPIVLFIGFPAQRPGLPSNLMTEMELNLAKELGGHFSPIQIFACGQAATLLAMEQATQLIHHKQADLCLVGGVDSYLPPETLEWLDFHERLHSNRHRYGFIPGEAAGFCLLASQRAVQRLPLKSLAHLSAVASAYEKNRINTDTVCIGEGLTSVFHQVFQTLEATPHRVEQIFCDLNGERYRADEYGFSVLRTREYFVDPSHFIAPADCWGEVGAATGTLLINLAVVAAMKGYAKGELSLIWTSSEGGERGAVLLHAKPQSV